MGNSEHKNHRIVNFESNFTMKELASMIDHTLLKPDSTKDQILQLCREAENHHFATVCVNPYWVPVVAEELKDSDVRITTVIGFPLGSTSTFAKMAETRDAIAAGATEIDMVINIGAIKSGDWTTVRKDIEGVVQAAEKRALVKVILETGFLTDQEKVKAAQIIASSGAHYVKTSTGFGPGQATIDDIVLLRKTVGQQMGIKASGGIKDFQRARSMIEAGADRIGTSSGVAIISGMKGTDNY